MTRELLSWGTHASLPALGFETAVDDASVTSPPFAAQPAWNGLASNTDVGISDFSTNLFTIYETSPIVIFRLGQNLSLKSLKAGIKNVVCNFDFKGIYDKMSSGISGALSGLKNYFTPENVV